MILKIIASIYKKNSSVYIKKFSKLTDAELLEQYQSLIMFLSDFYEYTHELENEIQEKRKIKDFMPFWEYKQTELSGCYSTECSDCFDEYTHFLGMKILFNDFEKLKG